MPLIINNGETITKETIEHLPISNCEEADKRLVFDAAMSNEAAIIVPKDMNEFLLLTYGSGQLECDLIPTRPFNMAMHKKMKFSINDFFSKCDQTRSLLRILSYLLKKSLMENFIFCAV